MTDLEDPLAEQPTPRQNGSLHVFRHRDFALFFSAASISNGGSWMQLVAVQALMYKLTEKGAWLGVSTVATLVPAVLITPYAGVLADRVSRRTILKITQLMQMIVASAMWVLYVNGSITPLWIVFLGFCNGACTGFQTPAWQSFVPLLVPPEDMLHAVRLNSVQYTVARAIGPALGGLVVAISGIGAAIFVNAVTFLLVIAVLLAVNPRENSTTSRSQGVLNGLLEGAHYVWSRRQLRLAVVLAFSVSSLGQSIQYVGSAISQRLFDHSAEGNAGLLSSFGVGSLLASSVMVKLGERVRRSRQVFCGFGLYTCALALLPLTHSYLVGMAAYFLGGCAHLTVAVSLNTLIQGSVPDVYRGRVVSFYLLGILGGIPVGTQVLGTVGDWIGFRPTLAIDALVFAGLAATLLASGWWRLLDETFGVETDEV